MEVADDGPRYHLRPPEGWLNDPNGLIHYQGRFHVFYQHVERGCEWEWGLVWGHAASSDLAHWTRLPPALAPSPGGADADGCWSGCATIDSAARPTILYTGVRLHSTPAKPSACPAATEGCGVEVGRLPAPDDGAGPLWTESQCMAVLSDPADDMLLRWDKRRRPFLPPPPPGLDLLGWRDPFIYARPSASGEGRYRLVVGAGIKGAGGALLSYSAPSLDAEWSYEGVMCSAADVPPGSTSAELGMVFECPLLAQLPGGEGRWLLAVSPYPCAPPNSPSNPVLYWVGDLTGDGSRFDLPGAGPPSRLDLGDLLYAPNCGRLLLWAWLEERRRPGTVAGYSGCLTLPRELSFVPGRGLVQRPPPELQALRVGPGWHAEQLEVVPGTALPLGGGGGDGSSSTRLTGQQLEVRLVLERGSAAKAGLLLKCWAAGQRGDAWVSYHWQDHRLAVEFRPPAALAAAAELELAALAEPLLQAVGAEAAAAQAAAQAAAEPAVGGRLAGREPGATIELMVFVDGSAVEVFTGDGQVLTTRVYRGQPGRHDGCGVSLVAEGGTAVVQTVSAWMLGSAYEA